MTQENQAEKSYVVKTLSISVGANTKFEAMFSRLEKYAQKHKLKAPKKSALFAKMVEAVSITPEEFFS